MAGHSIKQVPGGLPEKVAFEKDFKEFPGGSDGKESVCNARNPGLIPGPGKSLEEGMATHSRILAWRIPWTQEPGKELDMTEQLTLARS